MQDKKYPTVQELKDTINIMKKAYLFDDETSEIFNDEDFANGGYKGIVIRTTDKKSGTKVILKRDYLREEDKQ